MSSSGLKDQIQDAMKTAMKGGDKERLAVIRLMMAAMKQVEVDERIELDDNRILGILDKMVKQRRESISQFQSGHRNDLAEKERFELDLIQTYLPEPLSDEELAALIGSTIEKVGAESIRDMGKVMGALQAQVQGRADMKAVSQAVKSQLGS